MWLKNHEKAIKTKLKEKKATYVKLGCRQKPCPHNSKLDFQTQIEWYEPLGQLVLLVIIFLFLTANIYRLM